MTIATLRRSGARIVGVGVDPDGWDLEGMTTALRQAAPKLAYLIPDFHNPTGALMDEDQRARLGNALTRSRTVAVVEQPR